MILKTVHVRNFRSILDESLPCTQLTALVGRNGSGKSSFLRALELFYAPSPKFDVGDFYAEDSTQNIEIALTFADLDAGETERFQSYLEDGELTVVRVLSLADGKPSAKYHGSTLQNPDFVAVRSAGNARDIRKKYTDIRGDPRYSGLPTVRSKDEALEELKKWESAHPDQCTRQRDDGQFFGFTQVAQGYLGASTRFILVPAVRDASSEAQEGKGSAITQIMDLVVRSVLAGREDIAKLKEDTQAKYDSIMDPEKLVQLGTLERDLTETLQTYVPDARVSLSWITASGIEIPLPKAEVKLVEDDYKAAVARTGHGLQRAFILTMLQRLSATRNPVEQDRSRGEPHEGEERQEKVAQEKVPNLILAIEEPELYQHPSRQRHLARILFKLAKGAIPGVAPHTQVIYGTHSPLFVGIDRLDEIRLLRKVKHQDEKPKVTRLSQTRLDDVAEIVWEAAGKPGDKFTAETLRPRLQTIMTPWMNEGFFAEVVVLVEGEDDRAAVLGCAASADYDFDSLGISVVPCMGKNNLDRPLVIFRELGISTYVIWDGDKDEHGANPEDNRYLLRLHDQPEEDWPSAVADRFACFEKKLERTLREEIGPDVFDEVIAGVQTDLGIVKKDQAVKNPVVIRAVMERAKRQERTSATLERIVDRILALRGIGEKQ